MIIIVIELIWVLVDGMDIEAFRWVALAKALVTPRVFFYILWIFGFWKFVKILLL